MTSILVEWQPACCRGVRGVDAGIGRCDVILADEFFGLLARVLEEAAGAFFVHNVFYS